MACPSLIKLEKCSSKALWWTYTTIRPNLLYEYIIHILPCSKSLQFKLNSGQWLCRNKKSYVVHTYFSKRKQTYPVLKNIIAKLTGFIFWGRKGQCFRQLQFYSCHKRHPNYVLNMSFWYPCTFWGLGHLLVQNTVLNRGSTSQSLNAKTYTTEPPKNYGPFNVQF